MIPSSFIRFVFSITLVLTNYLVYSQCFNATKWPLSDVSAPVYSGDTVIVATDNFAGHYCVIKDLIPGKSYTFSASGSDYISHRIVGGLVSDPPIGHGTSPYTFTATGHNGEFHINLLIPPCGTDMTNRTTTFVCNDCSAEPSKIGINENNPGATLDVNGEVKLSDSGRPPQAGMVRWNSVNNDFEGYDGNHWRSFTKTNANWGYQPSNKGNEDNKLTALDGSGSDLFGTSTSIHGDYAIVGARLDDIGMNNDQGSAYIFIRTDTGWTQQAKLIASDGAGADFFGFSVSIHGDYAIVGANLDDVGTNSNQGSAYVFVRSGINWTQQAKLTASDGTANDLFGCSVSICGDYCIVGARNDDFGSAYVFIRSGTSWTQQVRLTASDGSLGDNFGVYVSISGDYAIVGAYFDDIESNQDQGSAYVFIRSGTTWTQEAILTASDGSLSDNFGISVSINGDYVIVGSILDDVGSNVNQGSAYIFIKK